MKTPTYEYAGARALVVLHERHLREFVRVWKQAQDARVRLPETDNPNYASLESLLHHVLACARSYMTWMCEKLALPDPDIRDVPEIAKLEAEVDEYLEHVLQRWRSPLAGTHEAAFYRPTYASRWNVDYCIDAMLEHAVVHPERHALQLQKLLTDSSHLSG